MTASKIIARACALALLSTVAAAPALAQTPFAAPSRAEPGSVQFASAQPGAPILAGSDVVATGRGFAPGQRVRLLYGAQPLAGGDATVDAEGRFEARLNVPADAAVGLHPIVVVSEGPYAAVVQTLKVSPTIAVSGEDRFDIRRVDVTRGLYQSAYSARNDAVFVTSAVGRPPVSESALLRLDADTLEIEARVSPAAAPDRVGPNGQTASGGVFAVYGVGVDDATDTVWVTQTRQNTVAVYRQSDLSLVRQFEPGTVNHARDVLIDPEMGKAYASATLSPDVVVFNTATPEVRGRITVQSTVRGETFSAASLSYDREAHRLYVVSNATNEIAVIDTRTDQVLNVWPVPGAESVFGVSHDAQTDRIFVVAQGSDNLVILNGADGSVIADVPVGAGALNVVFDPATRRAYVANRGASTIAVVDADGRLVANLGSAPQANHVALGADGVVYAVTKGQGEAENANTIWRITPR